MKNPIRLLAAALACLAALCTGGAFAQQPVTTNKATVMRATPEESAAVVQNLPGQASVQVLVRRGAWTQVKSGTNTGWVRMMDLRGGATVVESQAPASTTSSWLSSMNRLLLGSSSGGNQRAQSATVGIRGFSKDDLAKAEFNPAEFEKLKRYQASDADAQRFASQGRLQFRSVAYLAQDAVAAGGKGGGK